MFILTEFKCNFFLCASLCATKPCLEAVAWRWVDGGSPASAHTAAAAERDAPPSARHATPATPGPPPAVTPHPLQGEEEGKADGGNFFLRLLGPEGGDGGVAVPTESPRWGFDTDGINGPFLCGLYGYQPFHF